MQFAFLLEQVVNGLVLGGYYLLIALGLFLLNPLVRGVINLVRALGRRIRALSRKVRFRLQRRWRVEAATMLDGLPLFHDLSEDVLSDLAGRVRLRTFPKG